MYHHVLPSNLTFNNLRHHSRYFVERPVVSISKAICETRCPCHRTTFSSDLQTIMFIESSIPSLRESIACEPLLGGVSFDLAEALSEASAKRSSFSLPFRGRFPAPVAWEPVLARKAFQ